MSDSKPNRTKTVYVSRRLASEPRGGWPAFKSLLNPPHGGCDPVGTISGEGFSIRPGEAVLAMPGVYRFFVAGHRKT